MLLAGRQVLRDLDEAGVGALAKRRQHAVHEEAAPVFADVPPLDRRPPAHPRRAHLLEVHAAGAVLGREDHRQVLADGFVLFVTEHRFGGCVPPDDDAVRVHRDDRVLGDAVEHQAQVLLLAPSFVFGAPELLVYRVEPGVR